MVTCSTFKCATDAINLEHINEGDKCVAIEDDKCLLCETVNQIRSANAVLFNNDPVYALFGQQGTPAQISNIWNELAVCGIQKQETSNITITYDVEPPDFNQLEKDMQEILDTLALGKKDANARIFFESLRDVANTANNAFTDLADHNRRLKEILHTNNCSSQIVHNSRALPFTIGLYLKRVNRMGEHPFDKLVHFLNKRPQLCLEATLRESIKASKRKASKNKYTRKGPR